MKSSDLAAPYMLVASPLMNDPKFARTVMVIGHHDQTGALGWVVNRVLDVSFTGGSFWDRSGLGRTTLNSPWRGRGNAAPFDQKFYLVMNVAVGGTANYCPDGLGGKPWANAVDQPARKITVDQA